MGMGMAWAWAWAWGSKWIKLVVVIVPRMQIEYEICTLQPSLFPPFIPLPLPFPLSTSSFLSHALSEHVRCEMCDGRWEMRVLGVANAPALSLSQRRHDGIRSVGVVTVVGLVGLPR